jgi:dual-specificity kinase
MAKQILVGMKFLHEDLKLIHTDLKPENLLLVNNSYDTVNNFNSLPSNIKEKINRDRDFILEEIEKEEDSNGKKKEFSGKKENSEEIIMKKIGYKVPTKLNVKIIDFGGATYITDAHDGIINTRQYRSPEVIMGCCNWDEKSDVWSLACIFSELYTGELLFPTHDNKEHLAMIQKISSKLSL